MVEATTAAREFAVEQGMARDDGSRLCVIVEELVANLHEHGGLSSNDAISLLLVRVREGLTIVLSDPGRPFDPRTATSNRPRPDRGGGAGIEIVRAWTKFVDYGVQAGRNRLELLMPIH